MTPAADPTPAPESLPASGTAGAASQAAMPAAPGGFLTDTAGHDLKRRSARGGLLMIGSHAIQLAIGVSGTVVLARLLRPGDFGLLAMVATLTSFVATFRDLGLPTAAVQKKQLSEAQASGLFWINCAGSVAVAGLVAALAPVLAWFYEEPALLPITLVMAGGILISSIGMVHFGLLRRQMRFGAITTLEIGAMLAGVSIGIAAALAGAGYWALVGQQLTIYLWQASAAWYLCAWRPMRPARSAGLRDPELRSMLRYGRNTSLARVLMYLGRNMDAVLLGRFAGAGVLGLYQKAYQWSMMPFWQINTPMLGVAVSSFSRLQDDPQRYRQFVRMTLLGMFGLILPATALMFLEADGVVRLLLGPQWLEAIPVLRVLSLGAYFASFTLITRWLYLSEGRTGHELRWAGFSSVVMVAGVALGVRWGAMGVASAFAVVSTLLAWPGVWYCLRHSPLRGRDFWGSIWRPMMASLIAAAIMWHLRNLLPGVGHPLPQLLLHALIYLLLYLVCWVGLPGGRGELTVALMQLRSIARRG